MAEKPTKGTVVSFGNTPQAKDDNLAGLGTEDSGVIYLNVMANDLAGNGKSLWATDDGVSEGGDRPVDLLTQDAVDAQGTTALGAKIWITADGRVAYEATAAMVAGFQSLSVGQSITDSFTYAIQMGNGTLSWAKVNVTLAGTNDKPVVQNVSIAAVEDGQPVTGNFIGDDIDSDDDANSLTYNLIAQPAIGTLTKSGTTFTYAPGSNFQELAQGETQGLTFTYTATDKHGAVSDPASGAITVTGVNDAPSLKAGASELTEDGATVTVNLAALGDDIDSDNDGSTLVYSTLNTPPGGSATISGTTLSLSPGSDFQGLAAGETTSFDVKVQAADKHGATASNDISVKVTGVNDAPTVKAGALGTDEDGETVTLDIGSLADDVDSDDDASSLVYALVGPAPQHGVATLNDSMLSYSPGHALQELAEGETTSFALDVQATDKHGASTVNTVTVTITGDNDDPTLTSGKFAVFENGKAMTYDLSTLGDDVDSDDDGSTLTYAAPFPGPAGSTVSVSGTTFTFDPGTAFEELPELVVVNFPVGIEATDKHGDKAFSFIDIRLIGKNDAPTLKAGTLPALEDGGPVMQFLPQLGDDIDNDDGPGSLAYSLAEPVPAGQGSADVAGFSLVFTPGSDFQSLGLNQTQDVVLQLQAKDKHGATATNTVTVTVSGQNDAPTLQSGTLALAEDGGAATLDLATLGDDVDSDNDGSNLVYTTGAGLPQGTATVNAATLTVDPGTGYQYLAAGETKTFDLALKATDAHGSFQNNVVKVSVSGKNDAPVIGGDSVGGVTAISGDRTLTLEQWTGYPGPYDEASIRNHANANKANYTVSTTVVDFTDDPGGFAGEIPGSTPWPAAAATGASGTSGINDSFIARVTGQISVPVTDTYTFRTFNDDGVYLRVNNQLIISDHSHHPEKAFTGSITLAPGVYPVELFFFEGGGEASLEFTVKNSTGSYGHVVSTQQLGDSGVLNFNDIDLIDAHTVTVAPVGSTLGAMSATLTKDSTNGGQGNVSWNYAVDNEAVVSLGAGETQAEAFTVTVTDNHGASASQNVVVTISGINDAPRITTGTGQAQGNTMEDTVLTVSGQIGVSDVDANDTHTWSIASNTSGAYGSASVDGSGKWTYTVNNGSNGVASAVQNLAQGQTVTETFTVRASDGKGGTADQIVHVVVAGVNDAAVIGSQARTLTETNAPQSTGGTLSISDIDSAATFQAQTHAGKYGTFTLAANGAWTYAMNGAHDEFAAGVEYVDSFSAIATDGTTKADAVTVTIVGTPDGPTANDDANSLAASTVVSNNSNHVYWVDWTSANVLPGGVNEDKYVQVHGTITLGDGHTIGVTYTGLAWIVQLGQNQPAPGLLNYSSTTSEWIEPNPGARPYTSSQVDAGPQAWDIIGLNEAFTGGGFRGQIARTDFSPRNLSFSEPVENLFFAVMSMNSNGYKFDQNFQIVSQGEGKYGDSPDIAPTDFGGGQYGIVSGGEFHGVLKIDGSVEELSWTSQDKEAWNGFTVGTYGQAQTATVSGNVLGNDTAGPGNPNLEVSAVGGQAVVGASISLTLPSGATIKVDRDGDYFFDDKGHFAALAAGDSAVEIVEYTVRDNAGNTDTASLTITINGVNDSAVLGSAVVNLVESDAVLSAGGTLSISDVDFAEASFNVQSNTAGSYGKFSIDASGAWTYATNSALDHLKAGEKVTDSFSVTSVDGTATAVTVNITGTALNVIAPGNLASNGSFENNLTSWSTLGGDVDRVNNQSWQPAEGSWSLDLNAFTPGGVQQVVATQSGTEYSVFFQMSKNYDGAGTIPSATMRVTAGSAPHQDYTFAEPNSPTDMLWRGETYTFTADSANTTLSFSSLTNVPGKTAKGPALDDVVILVNPIINGFSTGDGDVLNLSNLLTSIGAPHDTTAFHEGYLRFLPSGADTLVQVDPNGDGDDYITAITLTGIWLNPAGDGENYVL